MQCNADIVDIEFQYDQNIAGIKEIITHCENNLILMSKHYIKREELFDHQQLSCSLKVHEANYDIIKIVSSFETLDEFNLAGMLYTTAKLEQPTIHINLGDKLKITRVLNKYLTPVSSLNISKTKTGKGQLCREEILSFRNTLSLDTHRKRNFYIFGNPIALSPSPVFHNKVFELMGVSDHYQTYETHDVESAMYMINKEETMGCSITIPLKKELYLKFKDYASADAKYIKAINTIMKVDGKIKVYNTDWTAIYNLLAGKLGAVQDRKYKILIIGTGGTSQAAIYAAIKLKCIPIIYNRRTSMEKNKKFMRELWKQNYTPEYCHHLHLFKYTNDFSQFRKIVQDNDDEAIENLSQQIMEGETDGQGIDAIVS